MIKAPLNGCGEETRVAVERWNIGQQYSDSALKMPIEDHLSVGPVFAAGVSRAEMFFTTTLQVRKPRLRLDGVFKVTWLVKRRISTWTVCLHYSVLPKKEFKASK